MKSKKLNINNWSYKSLLSILFILLIAVVVLARFIFPNQKVSAAWWNEGWGYRKAINISNTTNYNAVNTPHKIFIDTQSLISANKLLTSGNDFRVTDANGNLVKFQVEKSTLNTNKTGIWIETNINSKNTALYFLYYGNSSSSAPTFTTDLNTISNTATTVTVEMKDGFGYSTTSAHGRISDIRKNGSNLGVDGNNHYSDSYPGNWWDDRAFTQTILASGPLFVEVKYEDLNYGSYSSFGSNIKIFNNGFVETRLFTVYNTSGSEQFYYYLPFDNGTRNSVWINGSGTLVDQDADSGNLTEASLGQNWFGQRWTATGIYGGTIITKNGSDWTNGATSTRASYYQTNYSYNQAFINGTQREIRFGVFTGNGGITEMQQKGATYGALTNSLATEELSPAPIAYWKFDEGNGTTANDSSSNKDNGTILGSTWASEDQCISGKCLNFNGIDNTVDSSHNNYPSTWDNPFSISSWIFVPSSATWSNGYYGNIISKGSYTGSIGLARTGTDNQVVMWARGDNGSLSVAGYITRDKWYHLTGTWDGAKINLFINGISQGESGSARTGLPGSTPWYIGRSRAFGGASGNWFTGKIDEPKIYAYARTPAQIKSDYAAGLAHSSSSKGTSASLGSSNKNADFLSNGLVGYWKMDEGIGTTTIDSSGNNNTATFGAGTSAPSWSSGKYGIGLSFNGTQSYIDTPDINFNNEFTYSFWINNADNAGVRMWSSGTGSQKFGGLSNNFFVRIISDTDNSIPLPSINSWHHIILTRDSNNKIDLYVDGNNPTRLFSNIAQPGTTTLAILGNTNDASNQLFMGKMDEIRIYNRALSPSEVSSLYNWAPGPVGYWDFEENTGIVANDKSGNNHTGSLQSSPPWVTGKYGSALDFNSSGKRVLITNPIGQTGYTTVSLWYKVTNTASGSWRTLLGHQSTNIHHLIINSTSRNIGIFDGSWRDFGYLPPTDNQFHHYEVIYNNGVNATLYVDGVYKSQIATTLDLSVNPIGSIGNWASSSYWAGPIDDVKIYNYARTQKQITEDMLGDRSLVSSGGSNTGAIGHWKFDEGSGLITSDLSPRKNNAVISNATWTNDGKFNKALNFNGSSSVVSIGASLPINNEATFTGWFKINSFTDWASVFGNFIYGNNTTPFGMNFVPFNGFIRVCSGTGSGAYVTNDFTSTEIVTGKWIYGALVYNGTQIKVYINGKMIGSATRTINHLNTPFAIGRWATDYSGYYFPGTIDEVKIYNSALTTEEIALDYNRGASLQLGSLSASTSNLAPPTASSQQYCIPGDSSICSAPVAEWNFEENTGSNVSDSSGNNNTGMFGFGSSAPTWTVGKKNTGAALKFDGVDDRILLGSVINIGNTDWTVSAWIKTSSTIINSILSNKDSGPVYNDLRTDTSKIVYHHYNNAWLSEYGTSNIADNKWHFLTWANHNNQTIDLYVDGVRELAGAPSTLSSGSVGPVNQIGRNWSVSANASIDQVRVYNYARTPAQIAFDYNRGSPIGWWKLDECQGSIANDSSGLSNTGSISIGNSGSQTSPGTCSDNLSTSAWNNGKTGKYNSSLNFDGTDDYFTINQPQIQTTPNYFTVSGFINPIDQSGYVITPNSNGIDQRLAYDFSSQRLVVQIAESSDLNERARYSTTGSVPANKWSHFSVSINDKNIKIYINGVLNSEYNETINIGGWTSTWFIGQRSNSTNWYKGKIDDLKVFNYILTPTQVKTLYNNGAVSFNP